MKKKLILKVYHWRRKNLRPTKRRRRSLQRTIRIEYLPVKRST